jgi:HPt (histidine-containing phosphotransfer) domain-containing protein
MDFDRQVLQDQLGDDEEGFQEILALFLKTVPGNIESLAEAVRKKDAPLIRRLAHSLKGASGNVGALKISQTAKHIEQGSKEGDLNQADEFLKYLREDFRAFQEAVSRIIK